MARSLVFYLARLRNASLRELLRRLQESAEMEILRRKCGPSWCALEVPEVPRLHLAGLKVPNVHIEPCAELPPKMLFDIASISKEETRFRGVFFSRIKTSQLENDLRAMWEPARLQDVALALINAEQMEDRDAGRYATNTVLDWLADNPFPYGLHYLSVMECGLRIPVFVRCLQFASDLSGDALLALLKSIHHHAWITEKRLSLHSSLGNHTIAECVGLIFAGGVFSQSAEGIAWLDKGTSLLTQELTHQILHDGGPAEQSLSYHRFVLDLYWLAADFLESNGLRDCSNWKPRLEAGERFLAAFTGKCGIFPSIGDSDDGHAIGPGLAPCRYAPPSCLDGVETFPESGYTIVRRQTGLMLTVDHGPLGMAPLYNHGHADALSFTLEVHGVPIFIDPGTYRYNGVPRHRQYFKGTRAHNTVTVDGQDQARQLTSFIWDRPHKAGGIVREAEDVTVIEAWHEGYERLPSPVRCQRTFHVFEDSIQIKDVFSGQGVHEFDLHFHLHPEVRTAFDGLSLLLNRDGIELRVIFEEQGCPEIVRGQDEPLLGWYSAAYGLLEPTTTIRLRQTGKASDIHFKTTIHLGAI